MSKYKVGDKVRIVKSDRGYSEDFTGQECFVVGVDESGVDLQITYECGDFNTMYFTNEEVEPVENKVTETKWTKWTKWDGGEMPVKAGEMVKVCHRDGEVYEEPAGWCYSGDWEHTDHDGDIVAYCTLKQDAPKSENSVTIGGAASSEHYINDAMQPIEIMQMTFSHEEMLGFLKGNIIKYSFRAGKKQGESAEKDLNKVKQYKMWLDIVLKGGVINPRTDVI